ncbi:MAG TPA: hypothetical protein DCW74_19710 [Alteromonas australica]|uniref:Uncharacterized protein n=1 Tax=Alteromonas australica TaxID=589873 RepID=A0A350P9I3_9ALTE|nr:hypothetical protein [Alteromonas australica]|tara:strand:- start:2221 stop:2673 length:453 start_codon:yes stop_codon:yes gene_type:complete
MTRSNRTLTQFAADKLAEFVNNQWTGPVTQSKGNTTVKVFTPKDKSSSSVFQVFLFNESIFELDQTHLIIRNGGFFDSKGRPSRTTRERINGLLDAVGELKVIPQGTRMFLGNNGQKDTCFIGNSSRSAVLDSQCPDRIIVRDSKQLLVF